MSGLALVTGAAGFVGRHLVAKLRADGVAVRAAVMPGEDGSFLRALGAELQCADLREPSSLRPLFAGEVERVFHSAAICNLSTPYRVLRGVNVDGVRHLTAFALEAGVRSFVHISSTSVYGRSQGRPFTESSPRLPCDDYGRSKRDGEDVVWERIGEGLRAVVLRPCTVYGPGCNDGAGKVFSRATSISAIPGDGRARLSNVRVEDVAASALYLAATPSAAGRAFNVADDSHPIVEEALRLAARAFGSREPRLHLPIPLLSVVARAAGLVAWWRGSIPELESDALPFLRDDYIVGNGSLLETGYRLLYPDFEHSMLELGAGLSTASRAPDRQKKEAA